MFDNVDTAFSYERALIVRSFLQDFSKWKGSSLQLISNAHTAFLLCEYWLTSVQQKVYRDLDEMVELNAALSTVLMPQCKQIAAKGTPSEDICLDL